MSTNQAYEAVGFLGLGRLGAPIAANLVAAGVPVTVWNRTASKADALVAMGAKRATSAAEAARAGKVVLSILWDDASLDELVAEEEFLAAIAGGVHVSMTTVTPNAAKRAAARHAAHGSTYVEAPIFGPPAQAVAKTMLICTAGPAEAKARVKPLLTTMGGQRVEDFGETIGAATATKLVGNFMIVSAFGAMHEAFDLMTAAGVDPRPTLELLTTTILATPGNQRYAARLLAPPAAKDGLNSAIPAKDVGLFMRAAAEAGAATPLAEALRTALTSR